MSIRKRIYTGAECRSLDKYAIEHLGIPGITLMRRAGQFALQELRSHWPDARHIKVYCGSGNNAGDGYIVAGLALSAGLQVTVQQIGETEKLQGDARVAFDWYCEQRAHAKSTTDTNPDVLVDALLGTGTQGVPRPNYMQAIAEINGAGKPVLAIDLPSGIDPNTGGKLVDEPVNAHLTATFVGMKLCLTTGQGVNYAGQVKFDQLEVPAEVFEQPLGIAAIPTSSLRTHLPARKPAAYKNSSGHVMIIGGDLGTGGAALLAGEAALRTGAGLVSVLTRPEHVNAYLSRCPELMVRGIRTGESIATYLSSVDAIAIGPGLGKRRWGELLLNQVLESPHPTVIDADGLNLLATRETRQLTDCILTPHPGEAARLLGVATADIEQDRLTCVVQLAAKYACLVVLKGAGTLLADQHGSHSILPQAIPALATGGSGDVLTGVLVASRAMSQTAMAATETALWLHAQAGLRAAAQGHPGAVTATDIIYALRPWAGASA